MNKGYISFIIFSVVSIAGICAKLYSKTLWEWFGVLDTSAAVSLAILAIWGYFEYANDEKAVEIIFEINGKKYNTGLSLLRKNFQRSELMGVLGMIQKDQKKKFHLSFFQDKSVLKALQEIQTGSDKEFIIKMTKEEAEQFFL